MITTNENDYKYSLNRDEDFQKAITFVEIIKEKLTKGKKNFKFDFDQMDLKDFLNNLFVPDAKWNVLSNEKIICRLAYNNIRTLGDLLSYTKDFENKDEIYFEYSDLSLYAKHKTVNVEKSELDFYWQKMEAILRKIKTYKNKLKDETSQKTVRDVKLANLKMLAKDLNVKIIEND